MLRHIEDEGDLHILLNSGGNLLAVCSRCHRSWVGALSLTRSADAETVAGLVKSLFEQKGLADTLGIEPGLLHT